MAPAIFDTVAVEFLAGGARRRRRRAQRTVLRANGSTLIKPGYISVYQEGMDDVVQDDSDHVLPPMQEGDQVKLVGVTPAQHFTEPPPRFSEASLVKALEEYGIGRPSTYASIISTLRDREYVDIESRRFTATDIGKIVSRFLTQYFTTYVDYDFTAQDGGFARRRRDRRDGMGAAAGQVLEALHRAGQAHREIGQPRGGRAGARSRHSTPRAASR